MSFHGIPERFVNKGDPYRAQCERTASLPEETPPESVLEFANTYLGSVGQAGQKCGVNECKFCHVEHARPEIEQSIRASGHYIVEMERYR